MKKIYLDYASTTPVDKNVIKKMALFFDKKFGNTESLHSFGRETAEILENSRKIISKAINARPSEIIFTSSATESNNLALKGIASVNLKTKNPDNSALRNKTGKHIIISAIEHPSVSKTADWLKKQGFSVTKITVDKNGLVNEKDIKNSITEKTILVSVIHVSNETGVIQSLEEIGEICRKNGVYFHTDASQSFGKIEIDVKKMNIDLLTASSHKIYGPKGAGMLYIRQGIYVEPQLHGGEQEHGLRSSTVNVPAIFGFANAVEIFQKKITSEYKKIEKLNHMLIKEILKLKGVNLLVNTDKKIPHITTFLFDNKEGERLVLELDQKGVACSTGSACSSKSLEASDVLLAMGLDNKRAMNSLRVSLGRYTTEKEIKDFIKILSNILN